MVLFQKLLTDTTVMRHLKLSANTSNWDSQHLYPNLWLGYSLVVLFDKRERLFLRLQKKSENIKNLVNNLSSCHYYYANYAQLQNVKVTLYQMSLLCQKPLLSYCFYHWVAALFWLIECILSAVLFLKLKYSVYSSWLPGLKKKCKVLLFSSSSYSSIVFTLAFDLASSSSSFMSSTSSFYVFCCFMKDARVFNSPSFLFTFHW